MECLISTLKDLDRALSQELKIRYELAGQIKAFLRGGLCREQ